VIKKVLDYLFPNFTCLGCRGEINISEYPNICDGCLEKLDFAVPSKKDNIITPFVYNDVVAKMILGLKYSSDGLVAKTLAPFMRVSVKPKNYDFAVPIPLSKARQRERGFNQATLLAQEIFAGELEINENILSKVKSTIPQERMSTAERFKNQAGAYEVISEVKGKRILLVDDVITSGATTTEVARVLKEAGAKKVEVLAIARVVSYTEQ